MVINRIQLPRSPRNTPRRSARLTNGRFAQLRPSVGGFGHQLQLAKSLAPPAGRSKATGDRGRERIRRAGSSSINNATRRGETRCRRAEQTGESHLPGLGRVATGTKADVLIPRFVNATAFAIQQARGDPLTSRWTTLRMIRSHTPPSARYNLPRGLRCSSTRSIGCPRCNDLSVCSLHLSARG